MPTPPPAPPARPSACVEGLSSCTRIARSPTHWTVPVLTTVAAPVCLPALSPAYSPACRPSSSWPPLQPPPARPHANVSAVLVVLLPRAHSAYMNQERAEQFWSFPLVCCCWIAACLICWTLSICMLIVDCCIHRIPVFVSVSFLAILFINAAKVKFIIAS